MNITFKNVGQGDSIIIEWIDNEGQKRVGIIDCKKYLGSNPVLNFLILSDYNSIDFIFLSHAHSDHYSGLKDLLIYCQKKNILIDKFYHTAQASQHSIWKRSESMGELIELDELLEKIHEMIEKEIILNPTNISETTIHLHLNKDFSLGFLAPIYMDYQNLLNEEKSYLSGKSKHTPDMNLVSSLIKIYNENYYVLLTSDCVISSLLRAGKKDVNLNNGKLSLAQIPHHGSQKNFILSFWEKRDIIKDAPAVFSVGKHDAHRLPNLRVVDTVAKLGYKINSTNSVYGIEEYRKLFHEDNLKIVDYIEFGTTLIEETILEPINDLYNGDKRYIINPDGTVLLQEN